MKTINKIIYITLILIGTKVFSINGTWEKAILDDGNTTVHWKVSENKNKLPIIESIATTTAKISMQKIISILKDVENHKAFSGDKESKILKVLSDSEWVIYYYYDAPWPIDDSETFSKMTYSENRSKKMATFTITADSNLGQARSKDTICISLFNATYAFKDLGDGMLEVSITKKTIVPIKVPLWMINASYPDAPADNIHKLVKLAQEE